MKKYCFGSKWLLKFQDNQQNYFVALCLYTNISVNNKTQQEELGCYLLAKYFISRPLSLISVTFKVRPQEVVSGFKLLYGLQSQCDLWKCETSITACLPAGDRPVQIPERLEKGCPERSGIWCRNESAHKHRWVLARRNLNELATSSMSHGKKEILLEFKTHGD